MGINADMSEFTPTEKAVDITAEDFEELIDNFGDIKIWKEKFPPNSWTMRGVNIINLMDITFDQSLASIPSHLLQKTTDSFEKIQRGIRSSLNNSKLDIGVLTLDKNKLIPLNKEEVKSILLNMDESLNWETERGEDTVGQGFQRKEP